MSDSEFQRCRTRQLPSFRDWDVGGDRPREVLLRREGGVVSSVLPLPQVPVPGSAAFADLGTSSTKRSTANMLWGEDETQKNLRVKYMSENAYDPLEVNTVWFPLPYRWRDSDRALNRERTVNKTEIWYLKTTYSNPSVHVLFSFVAACML